MTNPEKKKRTYTTKEEDLFEVIQLQLTAKKISICPGQPNRFVAVLLVSFTLLWDLVIRPSQKHEHIILRIYNVDCMNEFSHNVQHKLVMEIHQVATFSQGQ
jgi:hypothetical protein